jgi:hypothetical protein
MKILVTILLTVACQVSAFSQTTVFFEVAASQALALPPNGSGRTAQGSFFLEPGNRFSGYVTIENWEGVTMKLFRTSSASELGTELFELTPGVITIHDPSQPGPDLRDFDLNPRVVPQGDVDDLFAGRVWLNVITPAFPNGEIRGQILMVPEPSTYALTLLGLLLGAAKVKRSNNLSS